VDSIPEQFIFSAWGSTAYSTHFIANSTHFPPLRNPAHFFGKLEGGGKLFGGFAVGGAIGEGFVFSVGCETYGPPTAG